MLGCSRSVFRTAVQTRVPPKTGHPQCQSHLVGSRSLCSAVSGGKRCRVVSQAAGNWEDWNGKESRTASQYPDVSLLTQTEKDMLLTLLPSSEQIEFISRGNTTVVTWLAAALIFLIAASKSTAIAVIGGTYPLYGNILKAAYKNFSVKSSTRRYVGIWHAQVLSLSIEDSYPGNAGIATSLRLSIGEPGVDGYCSELQVPWSPGCEQIRKSDQVEVLVMSSSQYFEDFVVVRDIYIPTLRLWLADYPFLKRDVFERLSEDVYWSRQSE